MCLMIGFNLQVTISLVSCWVRYGALYTRGLLRLRQGGHPSFHDKVWTTAPSNSVRHCQKHEVGCSLVAAYLNIISRHDTAQKERMASWGRERTSGSLAGVIRTRCKERNKRCPDTVALVSRGRTIVHMFQSICPRRPSPLKHLGKTRVRIQACISAKVCLIQMSKSQST